MSGFGGKLKSLDPLILDVKWKLRGFVYRVSLKDILVSITYIKLMV